MAYKPDGDLELHQQGQRPRGPPDRDRSEARTRWRLSRLSTELIEFRYVSVLTKQENGTLAYQSVRKEISKAKKRARDSRRRTHDESAHRASRIVRARDPQWQRATSSIAISFEVVGHANVARSLEREAELKIKLSKPEYAPGEEAEVEIQAPYVGAGLITVERDHIYNAQWFKTTTTESVQKIKIPEELEGNGYITVTFLRSLDSRRSSPARCPMARRRLPSAARVTSRW